MSETTREPDARQIATEARDRVRFEEEALALSDQVYRVARHLVGSREEAEDLMQETYARAFRSWRSFQPGTNLRAWLLRILTNLNIDRGRRQQRTPDMQPLEEVMQQFMDRVLPDVERSEAEAHLDECASCRKRYRFEETLRVFVRQGVAAEPMSVELKRKLSELRTPLQ